jgi:hypothetical protein
VTVVRIGFEAIVDMPRFQLSACAVHGERRVFEQDLFLCIRHHPEVITRLLVVVVIDPVIPMVGDPGPIERWLVLMNFNRLFGHEAQLSGGLLVRIFSRA